MTTRFIFLNKSFCSRFKIGKAQAAKIAKVKKKLREKWQTGVNINQNKSLFRNVQIDQRCFERFSRARSQNIPVSGPIVKVKAKELAEKLNHANFSASTA